MANKMPVLFIGHGSPLNAIQDNAYTRSLSDTGRTIPRPGLIIVISAHWLTHGSTITGTAEPRQIFDFYGFPEELYQVKYSVKGSPDKAGNICSMYPNNQLTVDLSWGIDHGAWSVLRHMYPNADIPVLQLSLDLNKNEAAHFEFAKALRPLRNEGVLFIGSGNIVHNLRLIGHDQFDTDPFDWAVDFDNKVKEALLSGNSKALIDYKSALSQHASLAVPTNDHYLPLLYIEALRGSDEPLKFIHEGMQNKSISMRSYQIG